MNRTGFRGARRFYLGPGGWHGLPAPGHLRIILAVEVRRSCYCVGAAGADAHRANWMTRCCMRLTVSTKPADAGAFRGHQLCGRRARHVPHRAHPRRGWPRGLHNKRQEKFCRMRRARRPRRHQPQRAPSTATGPAAGTAQSSSACKRIAPSRALARLAECGFAKGDELLQVHSRALRRRSVER